jgi:transposase-like protein
VTVRRPRVRGLEERFESRILPLFVKRTQQVRDLLPELYLHGLAERDFDLALRGLLGEDAPLSASTVARLKEKWDAEYEAWRSRPLDDMSVVYAWADGIYVKAGFEKEKAAMLVVVVALSDGRKEFVAIESGYRESVESWSAVLRDLKRRGMRCPKLVIADGHLGIWGALRAVYPDAEEQRCWNHRILNVLDKLPKNQHRQAKLLLVQIPRAETCQAAQRLKGVFQQWCQKRGFERAGALLDEDWDRMVTFYRFPKQHWTHLRTTNPIESPFAAVRLRTTAAKRYKRVEHATAVIWKTLMVAQRTFRKLNAPELLAEVYNGATYVNGNTPEQETEKDAA